MDSLRLMNLDEQLRTERGFKDIIEKIISFFKKLLKKGKKAISRSVRQAPEPEKPEAGGEDKKEEQKEKESDLKLGQKIKQFWEEVKKAFKKIFDQK